MTKTEAWQQIVRQNPSFLAEGARLSVNGTKKFFDTVWDTAIRSGETPDAVETLSRMFGMGG